MKSQPNGSSLPVTTIGQRRGLAGLDVRELWAYRELLYFFIWRNLKVRYRQTAFGAAWAVIQPLGLMVAFTAFLGRVNGITASTVPYPLFAYVGLVPWVLFASSVLAASASLIDASNLLQKVYFPRLLLPISAASSYLLDFAIAVLIVFGLIWWYGIGVSLTVLWLIPFTALALLTSLAVGILMAAVNVRYRDVRYALPFVVQLWLFATPVAYDSGIVPEKWEPLFALNPMTGVVEGFRWALLGGSPAPVGALVSSAVVTGALLLGGVAYFRQTERTFADVI